MFYFSFGKRRLFLTWFSPPPCEISRLLFSWPEEKEKNRMMYFDGPGREKRRDLMTLVPKSSSISLPSFPLSPSTYIFLFSEQRRRRLRSSKSPARLIRKYLLEERCTRRNSSCFSLKIGLGLSVARSIPPPFFASLLVRCQGFFALTALAAPSLPPASPNNALL